MILVSLGQIFLRSRVARVQLLHTYLLQVEEGTCGTVVRAQIGGSYIRANHNNSSARQLDVYTKILQLRAVSASEACTAGTMNKAGNFSEQHV